MPGAEYYRKEAERCRKLADASKDPEAARRWRALVRDYTALADELDERPPPSVQRPPMQQQPVQQQQRKNTDDEE